MQKNAFCNRSNNAMPNSGPNGSRFSAKILLVMKLTAFFLFIALVGVNAKGISQSVTLSGRNIPLEKTFATIRTQTGYLIFCDRNLLKDAQTVTVSAADMPLKQFLDIIFRNQSLQYLIQQQTIFVSKKSLPTILEELRPVPLQGHVTDGQGSPLEGATIKVKGSGRSVITDAKGYFTITVNVGDVIVVTFVGFKTQELSISNSTDLNIMLLPAPIAMDEVTVNVSTGYQTISTERATGSYGVVTAKELKEVPSNNLMERLEGKVPGVRFDIRNNSIQIRSVNTFTSNTAPLIVIDGFPMIATGDAQRLTSVPLSTMANGAVLSTFNPDDIEQITFLKDAVATSVWGARGANGVIVIQTKHGKKGAPLISISSTVSISKPASLSKLNWMSSAQYADLETEMVNKGFYTDPKASPYYNPLYTTNSSDVVEWLFKVQRGTATQAEADAAIARISARSNYSQIEKYLLQTAVTQQHNLSVSGGGENNTYYISGNFNKDVPIYRSNKSRNVILTANFTNDLFNRRVKLRTGFNYQYTASTINLSALDALTNSSTSLRPYDMLVDADGNHIQRNINFRPEVADSFVKMGYLPFTYNAIDELNYSNTKTASNQIRLNMGVNTKITNWMDLDLSGTYQRNINNSYTINDVNSYTGRIFMNTGTTISTTTGKPVYNIPYGGTYLLSDGSAYDYSLRGQLNFSHNLAPDHYISGLFGTEIRETYNKSYGSTRYGYDPDANSFGTVNPTTPYMTMFGYTTTLGNPLTGISEQRNRYLSYYGNAAYVYKNRYNLSGSARFDDYTLLGLSRSKRAKPFWSAGFKWNAQQEQFMQGISWLNSLDVRLTYGTGGAVPLGGYNTAVISLNATDPNTQLPIAAITNPANQQLGWETTRTLNEGVDLRTFNNRLMINADVYQKKSSGILAILPFNPTYGWSSLSYNTGKMKSSGFEFGITGKLLDKKDWTVTSTFNFSYNKTKVTDNRYNTATAASLVQGGFTALNNYPVGATFVYRSAGLDPATGQTQIYDRDKNIIKNTTNLTSAFDINDLKYVGVKIAPYQGGFFNTFRYKNFDLGVQMTYYLGHVFLKPAITNYPTYTGFSGTLGRQIDLAYRWKQTGDEAFTDVPGLTNVNSNSVTRYRFSDKLVRSADNIRLQQISLGYHFPASMLPKRVFRSLSVSGNVRNLGMIWAKNKEKLDPEYLNANSNYYSMPPVTSYLFNINASF
jgi:TonB-linked SusC/RagA family outer membrane protein